MNYSAQETGDTYTVNCRFKHSIVSLYFHLCKEYLTADCGKIKNTVVTPYEVLNVFVYWQLHLDETQYLGERVNWS